MSRQVRYYRTMPVNPLMRAIEALWYAAAYREYLEEFSYSDIAGRRYGFANMVWRDEAGNLVSKPYAMWER